MDIDIHSAFFMLGIQILVPFLQILSKSQQILKKFETPMYK